MKALAVAMSLFATAAMAQQRGSDEQVRGIIFDALDHSLHDQVQHLFSNWMKDPGQGPPTRAAAGIRKAVAAYRHAIHAIETEKLTWDTPPLPRPRPRASLQ